MSHKEGLKTVKLPRNYKKNFYSLSKELLININKLIDEHMEPFKDTKEEMGIFYGTVINALTKMLGMIILELAENGIDKQDSIKTLQEFTHQSLDGNLESLIEKEEETKDKDIVA